MRLCLALLLIGLSANVVTDARAHALTVQECFEGGDFIANAALARDNGMSKQVFLERLVADIQVIQAFPPQLRWFVVDPDDAEFLHAEATLVFDVPQPSETHRAQFLARCFYR